MGHPERCDRIFEVCMDVFVGQLEKIAAMSQGIEDSCA